MPSGKDASDRSGRVEGVLAPAWLLRLLWQSGSLWSRSAPLHTVTVSHSGALEVLSAIGRPHSRPGSTGMGPELWGNRTQGSGWCSCTKCSVFRSFPMGDMKRNPTSPAWPCTLWTGIVFLREANFTFFCIQPEGHMDWAIFFWGWTSSDKPLLVQQPNHPVGAPSKQHFRVKDLSLISNCILISPVVWLSKLMSQFVHFKKQNDNNSEIPQSCSCLAHLLFPLCLAYFFPHRKWLMNVCWMNCWGEKESNINCPPPF